MNSNHISSHLQSNPPCAGCPPPPGAAPSTATSSVSTNSAALPFFPLWWCAGVASGVEAEDGEEEAEEGEVLTPLGTYLLWGVCESTIETKRGERRCVCHVP